MDAWRLITEHVATLQELKTMWTFEDIQKALAVLNMKSSVQKAIDKILKARAPK
jgi:hypothetical protein